MTWRGRMRPLKKVESGLLLLLGFVFLVASELNAQKKPLDTDDIDSWKRITERVISPDGRWIAYKTEPWKGNSKIYLYNRKGEKQFEHDCGTGIKITGDSEFLIFTIKPEYEHVRELKLRNSENPDMPGDLLGMLSIRTGNLSLITNIKNYRIPKKWAGWLAYQVEAQSDAAEEDKIKEIGKKKESEKNGYSAYSDDSGHPVRAKAASVGAERRWA